MQHFWKSIQQKAKPVFTAIVTAFFILFCEIKNFTWWVTLYIALSAIILTTEYHTHIWSNYEATTNLG